MKFSIGDKTLTITLKPEAKQYIEDMKTHIEDMFSLDSYTVGDMPRISSKDDIEWDRIEYSRDKLSGIYELASLDLDKCSSDDIVKLLAYMGFIVFKPSDDTDVQMFGDILCEIPSLLVNKDNSETESAESTESNDDPSASTFYVSIPMVKNAYLDESAIDGLFLDSLILEAKPVVIAPLGLDSATFYQLENYNIEVISKQELLDIQKGIRDRANNKGTLTDAIIRGVALL